MLSISFKHDLERLRRELNEDQKQVRYAMARAMTKTAQDVKEAIRYEMINVFDWPTKYTVNSLRIKSATKDDLVAIVWIKDEPGNDARSYLLPQMEGGSRVHKPFEARLIRQGLLPSNLYAVPGKGAKLDRHGNIPGGELERILSALGAAEQFAGYQANRTARSAKRLGKNRREFFVSRPGQGRTNGLPLGVWERTPQGIKPVLLFVRKPTYRVRLRFNEVGNREAERMWTKRLAQALAITMRTRR